MKKLTCDNYYEADDYFSVSTWKAMTKCEVGGKEPYNSIPSTAMLVGSYVDAYVEGTLDKFIEEHPSIISSRGETKGQLKSDFKQAEEVCRFIDNDERLQRFLSGEKQTVMSGEICGVPFKIKMDSYSEGIAINDLKVMATITKNGKYYDFITAYGYDVQLACYQEIVRQNTGKQLPCYIVVVTKETPTNSAVIQLPQEIMDVALYKVQSTINHLYDVKIGKEDAVGCGNCSHCISKRTETPLISYYDLISENAWQITKSVIYFIYVEGR